MDDYVKFNCGALIFPLKIISHPKGDIMHALKNTDFSYRGFGEVYFSKIYGGQIKGWKLHTKMEMNFVVPSGSIKFYLRDSESGKIETVIIGNNDYKRLFIPSNVWVAFEGVCEGENLLMNLASIPHDPNESISEDF